MAIIAAVVLSTYPVINRILTPAETAFVQHARSRLTESVVATCVASCVASTQPAAQVCSRDAPINDLLRLQTEYPQRILSYVA